MRRCGDVCDVVFHVVCDVVFHVVCDVACDVVCEKSRLLVA